MKDNELAKALLKQDGLGSPATTEAAIEEIQRRMALAKVRVRRIKRLAIIAWIWSAVALAILVPLMLILQRNLLPPTVPAALRPICFGGVFLGDTVILTLPIAIAFTISYWIRSRNASLLEIKARLMRLEEQISRLTGSQGMSR